LRSAHPIQSGREPAQGLVGRHQSRPPRSRALPEPPQRYVQGVHKGCSPDIQGTIPCASVVLQVYLRCTPLVCIARCLRDARARGGASGLAVNALRVFRDGACSSLVNCIVTAWPQNRKSQFQGPLLRPAGSLQIRGARKWLSWATRVPKCLLRIASI
jgi:hypothetical protein